MCLKDHAFSFKKACFNVRSEANPTSHQAQNCNSHTLFELSNKTVCKRFFNEYTKARITQ